jgi:hypothetical protein
MYMYSIYNLLFNLLGRSTVNELRRLNSMRYIARPSDMCLFYEDVDKYTDQSAAQMISVYVHKQPQKSYYE